MKKILLVSILYVVVSGVYSQDTEKKVLLSLFTPHWNNFEYLYGPVSEIHYQAYHLVEKDGKYVKGPAFTYDEGQNVEIRQPWSYYFDKNGDIYQMKLKAEKEYWEGIVHTEKGKITSIYWSMNDTLRGCQLSDYSKKGEVKMRWKNIPGDEISGGQTFYLDANGNVLKRLGIAPDGSTGYTQSFIRFPDGRIKESFDTDPTGKRSLLYVNYKYNDHGLLEYHDIELLNYKEPKFPTVECNYEYDDHGNWIKRIHPGWIVIERSISYFE